MTIVKQFQLKFVIFTAVKNFCISHGCVFVMAMMVYDRASTVYSFCLNLKYVMILGRKNNNNIIASLFFSSTGEIKGVFKACTRLLSVL